MGVAFLWRNSTAFTVCCSTLLALLVFELSDRYLPLLQSPPGFPLPLLSPRNRPLPVDHTWGSILRPFEKQVEPHQLQTYALPSASHFSHVDRRQVKILLAIAELSGLHKNGGIGTAYRALAESLSDEGFDVTILMLHARETFPSFVVRSMGEKMKKRKITLEYLPSLTTSSVSTFPSDWASRMSLHLHDHLLASDGTYDIVQFHDNHGHGYHSMLAKQQGLAFKNTKFIVGMHGPNTGWATLLNGEFPSSEDQLITDHLERRSCEMADAVVAPSEYILKYLLLRGWKLPKVQLVVWNLAGGGQDLAQLDGPRAEAPVTNIVFYGRLEGRKGIRVFLSAMDSLVAKGISGFTADQPLIVSFLGRDTIDADGTSTKAHIEEHGRKWRNQTQGAVRYALVTGKNREGALAYLKDAGNLAVMPSLIDNSPYTVMECIAFGIDFIASSVGGIPELIDESNHKDVLFQPNPAALARKLDEKLRHKGPVPRVRPPHPFEDSTRDWVALHLDLYAATQREKANRVGSFIEVVTHPSVSVCVLYDGQFTDTPVKLLDSLHSLVLQSVAPSSVSIYANLPSDYPSSPSHDYGQSILTVTSQYKWRWIDLSTLASPLSHCARASDADHLLLLRAGHLLHPDALEAFLNVTTFGPFDVVSSSVATIQGPGAFSESCAQRKSKVCKTFARETFFGDALSIGLVSNKIGPDSFLVNRKTFLSSLDTAPIKHHFDSSSAAWEFYLRSLTTKRTVTMLSHTYLAKRDVSPKDKAPPSFAMNNWLKEYQAFSPVLDHADLAASNLAPFLMYAKGLVQSHIRPAIRPLAHSKDDFSSFQGYHGWTYGFQDLHEAFNPSREPSFFHGDSWQHPDVVDGILFVSKEGMHPYRSPKENLVYAPVRTWSSPATLENAVLKLDYEGFHHCGDGTDIKVLVEDSAKHTMSYIYSAETFDAGPISWTSHLNLTHTMKIHLIVDPKITSDCDHVNAILRILPPGLPSVHHSHKDPVPLEVLRQRHSRTLTDTTNNFALHTREKAYKDEFKAELARAFAWQYRFFDTTSGKEVLGVINEQGTSARIKADMEVPYISEHVQHPSAAYSTSRYATIDLPPGSEYLVSMTAHYPKGFCEAYCGDGALVELYIDGERRIERQLAMTESLREEIRLPAGMQKVDLDIRTLAGRDDWFDSVELHLKVQRA